LNRFGHLFFAGSGGAWDKFFWRDAFSSDGPKYNTYGFRNHKDGYQVAPTAGYDSQRLTMLYFGYW
jgi:hypothetical protein